MPTLEYPEGATPLDLDELGGLRLAHVATRAELDLWEQENILRAEDWLWSSRKRDPLDEAFVPLLHKRMFGDVWKWAGAFRISEKNLGVPAWNIGMELRNMCGNGREWIASNGYPPDEIAARLHHKLVWIHPFANGNGRHARLWTDFLLTRVLKRPRFTWGSADLATVGTSRERYLAALRAADARDFGPLLEFVRS